MKQHKKTKTTKKNQEEEKTQNKTNIEQKNTTTTTATNNNIDNSQMPMKIITHFTYQMNETMTVRNVKRCALLLCILIR